MKGIDCFKYIDEIEDISETHKEWIKRNIELNVELLILKKAIKSYNNNEISKEDFNKIYDNFNKKSEEINKKYS